MRSIPSFPMRKAQEKQPLRQGWLLLNISGMDGSALWIRIARDHQIRAKGAVSTVVLEGFGERTAVFDGLFNGFFVRHPFELQTVINHVEASGF